MRLELIQLIDVRVEEVSRPLREEVAALKLLLARVGDSLEPTEACTSVGLELAHVQASFPLDSIEQKSPVVAEEHLYGCISPRRSPCLSPQPDVSVTSESGDLASVMQITPELHEFCGESSVVPLLELGSSEALTVASMPSPSQSLASMVTGEVSVDKADALFVEELSGLLSSLEAVSPGYGKDIACILAGEASEDMIRKVDKSLKKVIIRGRSRKRGVARKTARLT
jgi:hypothetical protein